MRYKYYSGNARQRQMKMNYDAFLHRERNSDDQNNGEVAERFKAVVLKITDPKGSVGSNPTLSATND